jgi:hypothetical protein
VSVISRGEATPSGRRRLGELHALVGLHSEKQDFSGWKSRVECLGFFFYGVSVSLKNGISFYAFYCLVFVICLGLVGN